MISRLEFNDVTTPRPVPVNSATRFGAVTLLEDDISLQKVRRCSQRGKNREARAVPLSQSKRLDFAATGRFERSTCFPLASRARISAGVVERGDRRILVVVHRDHLEAFGRPPLSTTPAEILAREASGKHVLLSNRPVAAKSSLLD